MVLTNNGYDKHERVKVVGGMYYRWYKEAEYLSPYGKKMCSVRFGDGKNAIVANIWLSSIQKKVQPNCSQKRSNRSSSKKKDIPDQKEKGDTVSMKREDYEELMSQFEKLQKEHEKTKATMETMSQELERMKLKFKLYSIH